jgi:hypothetical protein
MTKTRSRKSRDTVPLSTAAPITAFYLIKGPHIGLNKSPWCHICLLCASGEIFLNEQPNQSEGGTILELEDATCESYEHQVGGQEAALTMYLDPNTTHNSILQFNSSFVI